MKKIAIALSLVFAVISCNKAELNEEKGEGLLNMRMSIDAQTKAALTSDELLNTASVKMGKISTMAFTCKNNINQYLVHPSFRLRYENHC